MDGAKLVVVDNTEAPGVNASELPAGGLLIAVGHNSGMPMHRTSVWLSALDEAATVVFFDQNSKIGPGFLRHWGRRFNAKHAE